MRPSLTLKERGLTARLYGFSQRRWRDFGGQPDWRYPVSDLCTVIRTITVLLPLALVVNALTLVWCGYVAYKVAALLWAVLFTTTTLIVIAMIGGLVLTVVAIFLVVFVGEETSKALGKSETFRVASAYVRARKESICPTVEFGR